MRRALCLCVSVVLLSGCPAGPPRAVVYDLAERLPVAERWSSRDVVLFGTPAAEPHLASGFFREAGAPKGDRFAWAGREAAVSLTWTAPVPRAAVLDVAPYAGLKGQAAQVFLNEGLIARLALNDSRFRYAVPLPEVRQRAGENRLRFVFDKTASPSQSDPTNADLRQLAAAFYSLTVAGAGDPGLDDLLGREAPRPFALSAAAGGLPEISV